MGASNTEHGLGHVVGLITTHDREPLTGRVRSAARLLALEVLMFALGLNLAAPGVALGGHTLGPGGDCWRSGTPLNCRATWLGGDQHTIYVRIINQLNDTTLWNYATQGCAAWENAAGPQFCHPTAFTNDSWVYFKRDDSIAAPNAYTWNCTSSACPTASGTGQIAWSEIYVPLANKNSGNLNISIDGHEIGHAYGLDHHGTAGSNAALMTQGSTLTAPNSNDIGPLPACSTVPVGGNGSGGTRCIFNGTL